MVFFVFDFDCGAREAVSVELGAVFGFFELDLGGGEVWGVQEVVGRGFGFGFWFGLSFGFRFGFWSCFGLRFGFRSYFGLRFGFWSCFIM